MRKHLTKTNDRTADYLTRQRVTNDRTADYLTRQRVLISLACHLNFSHVPNRQTPLKLWTYSHVRSTTLRTSWSGKMYHHAMVIFSCTQKWCAENSGEETKKWRMNMVIQTKLPVALLPPNYAVKAKNTLFTEDTHKVMSSEKRLFDKLMWVLLLRPGHRKLSHLLWSLNCVMQLHRILNETPQ